MATLPANYVTLLQLKERYLKEKEEQERRKKEEEELRRQKLKEEEAKLRKPDGVVVVRNRGRFDRRDFRQAVDRREFRQAVDRREFRPVVDRREFPPVVDQNVSECEGGEIEGKSEEPEEENKWKKKKKKKWGKKRKNVRAEKEEVSSEKEGVAVPVVIESGEKEASYGVRRNGGERRRAGVEFRSKNVEEIEPKFRDLKITGETEISGDTLRGPNSSNAGAKDEIEPKVSGFGVNGETERRNGRWRRPNCRNVGAKEEIEQEGKDFRMNGETERGNDRRRRPNHRNGRAREEIEPKVRDFEMNGETERGSDRLMGANSEVSEPKVKDVWKDGETEREDRLKGPNSEGESEPKVRELTMTGEIGGRDRLWRPKGKNVGGKDETGPKVMDSLVKAESVRGDERFRRPSRSDDRGNRKPWGYKTEREDRLKGPNSEGESEPKVGELTMTGEIGGRDRLWRPKGKNVGGKDETGPKVMDLLVKAESDRGDERFRRPSRSDDRGNRKPWGYKKEQWVGLAWVKKGEVSDGNAAGVQSSEHSISGSTRASLNANPSGGPRRVIQ